MKPDDRPTERRGFLRALGLGTAAAAATGGGAAAQREVVARADAVPAKDARKETKAQRVAARYRVTADVAAFYRTNGYE